MIGKEEYYRGALLAQLLEDPRCEGVVPCGNNGYIAHKTYFYTRYSTKTRSPWNFSFATIDNERIEFGKTRSKNWLVVLICGGDGFCVLTAEEFRSIIGHNGGISVSRKHNTQFSVKGSAGKLSRKIPLNRWPSILFN